jgi:glycerate kinase
MRVLIVPDKFKGTLRAREAAAAIAEGWQSARPDDVLEELPMSDGGDGFGEVIGSLLGAECRSCATVDCAGRPRHAEWWLHARSRVAVVEAAQVNGLALLPRAAYHPYGLDTFGLGAVLEAVESARAARVYVGIGGSATNDGGFGLARALGWRFHDAAGNELRSWTNLDELLTLKPPQRRLDLGELTIAADVENPLLGEHGATQVYGPQKGLIPSELTKAEACLRRLAEIVDADAARALSCEPGAGAAGGLGFGLRAFCGGAIVSGASVFAALSDLERRIEAADLVITGEGRLDAQSFMGKGVGRVAAAAARANTPCWCFAGSVSSDVTGVASPTFRAFPVARESTSSPSSALRALAQRTAALW